MAIWRTLGQWRQASASNSWAGRDGAGLLSLGDDLFILGGWNPSVHPWPAYTCSEIWKSSDRGATWTQLADAPWEKRHTAGWLVHNNKLWVIGGDVNTGHYQKDVWSSPDGTNWTQVSGAALPLAMGRTLHQVFSHAGKMWIVGGQTMDEFTPGHESTKPGSPYYDDVWSSEDGVTWEQVSSGNAWSPKASIIGSAVKDGFMWLIAGGAYDTESNPRVYKFDVWRSADGVTWTQTTSDGGFPARQYNCAVTLGEDLVLIAGYGGANIADAWASTDGTLWRELRGVPWEARHAASVATHKGEVMLLGGPLSDTAVWALS